MKELAFSVPGVGNTQISIAPVAGMPNPGNNATLVFQTLIQWGITLLLAGAAILALFFLIWGGISWIMSGGEKEKIEEARNRIVYAILGLIIVFLSFFIINFVGTLFGINPLNLKSGLTHQCPVGTHLSCGPKHCVCSKNK